MTTLSDIIELDKNNDYALQTEKLRGQWWLELIERSTGMTWILYCNTKKSALSCFKGMTLEQTRACMNRLKVEPIKMYKAGVI